MAATATKLLSQQRRIYSAMWEEAARASCLQRSRGPSVNEDVAHAFNIVYKNGENPNPPTVSDVQLAVRHLMTYLVLNRFVNNPESGDELRKQFGIIFEDSPGFGEHVRTLRRKSDGFLQSVFRKLAAMAPELCLFPTEPSAPPAAAARAAGAHAVPPVLHMIGEPRTINLSGLCYYFKKMYAANTTRATPPIEPPKVAITVYKMFAAADLGGDCSPEQVIRIMTAGIAAKVWARTGRNEEDFKRIFTPFSDAIKKDKDNSDTERLIAAYDWLSKSRIDDLPPLYK